ncbi:MAG TPA: hypothetical protein DDY37_05130 [Legionella sp.]|nr:hypothetical protein [Legionella sp.]
MSEKQEQMDWSAWFSTYGMLTAERILARFNIHLPPGELSTAAHDPRSVYFQLLRVPLKNVFNGIILQQAHDYQIYSQKLFIDYLLSGEDTKDKDQPGGIVREDLEQQRTGLIEMGERFQVLETSHQILIAESQATLIALSKDFSSLLKTATDDPGAIVNKLASYVERSEAINIDLRSYRREFYDAILKVTALLELLPDYRTDLQKQAENRETLAFDAQIGEK